MQFGAYLSGVGERSDPNLLAGLAHGGAEIEGSGRAQQFMMKSKGY